MALLAAGISASLSLSVTGHAQEGGYDQLDRLRSRLDAARDEIRGIQSRAGSVRAQIASIDEQARAVARALEAARDLIESTRADIRVLEGRIATKERRYEAMSARARELAVDLYKGGAYANIEVLLGAEEMDDLLSKAEYLGTSQRNTLRIMVETARLEEELRADKAELEDKLQIAVEARNERIAQAQHLRELRAAQRAQLTDLRQEIVHERAEADDLEARSQELAAELARQAALERRRERRRRQRLAELAAKRRAAREAAREAASRPAPDPPAPDPAPAPDPSPVGSPSSGYGFIWPLGGAVTSGYGYRWGRMHTGIDIDGVTGQTIRASKAGTVLYATYDGGYGNHVVVNHGGGFATLYGHASALYVASGESVSQGEAIAAVGCTGSCTGDHLHFEVRVNGAPRDPMAYLP